MTHHCSDHRAPAWIDAEMPYRGPCGFCGSPDARHRTLDAIVGCLRAGDPVDVVADGYELSVSFVQRLARQWET